MKRKPRAASSRGSIRRSCRLSSEKRKPRSASAARTSCSIGPAARKRALGEFEHERRRDRAIGVEEVEQLLEYRGVGQGRFREIAEQADLAVLEQQPPHHLHAAEHHQIVDLRHQAGAFAPCGMKSAAGSDLAGLGAQPRHRLVVADLALRQRHDRLQIEVDAVGVDGAPDHRKPFLVGGVGVGGLVATTWRRSPVRARLERRVGGHRDRRRRHRRTMSSISDATARSPRPAPAAAGAASLCRRAAIPGLAGRAALRSRRTSPRRSPPFRRAAGPACRVR